MKQLKDVSERLLVLPLDSIDTAESRAIVDTYDAPHADPHLSKYDNWWDEDKEFHLGPNHHQN